jgi:pimeloyl-ACP methyl ester carboxylesterase
MNFSKQCAPNSLKLRAMNEEIQSEKNIEVDAHFRVEYSRHGDGAPLVFLHAFPLSHKMWHGQMEAFGSGWDVIAPNARGFGNTTPFSSAPIDGEPSIAQMAQDLNAFLDALKITEPIVLCGLSMGGYTALNFMREYSHRVRALILCDTRADADSTEALAKREENIRLVREQGSWNLAEKMTEVLLGETTRENNPELILQVLQWGSDQTVTTIADALAALRDRLDMTDSLHEISVPTLLIFGEEDAIVPAAAIQTLQQGITDSCLEIISDAGHLPNLEQPQKFNSALSDFLRSLN